MVIYIFREKTEKNEQLMLIAPQRGTCDSTGRYCLCYNVEENKKLWEIKCVHNGHVLAHPRTGRVVHADPALGKVQPGLAIMRVELGTIGIERLASQQVLDALEAFLLYGRRCLLAHGLNE